MGNTLKKTQELKKNMEKYETPYDGTIYRVKYKKIRNV